MLAAFACFCEENSVCPKTLAEFYHLVDKRRNNLAKWSIETKSQEDFEKDEIADNKIIRKIEALGFQMGWIVEFNSVIPTIIDKNGNHLYPPFL